METIFLERLVSLQSFVFRFPLHLVALTRLFVSREREITLGRIAGEGGKVKFSIENASRTRIVLAET